MFAIEHLTLIQRYINESSDPRVKDWPFMASPWPMLVVLVIYLSSVLYFLPLFMASREPFILKKPIFMLNAFQVTLNVWIVKEMYQSGWGTHYNILCQPMDYSMNSDALRMAVAVWVYTMTKLLDLLDTVIFVLRKKYNQVSYLHLYHHVSLLGFCWFVVKFSPGGSGSLAILINSFIHVLMYTYYMLAAMGPKIQKYLWWKKYLTSLQMIQFVLILGLNFNGIRMDCDYSRGLSYLFIPLVGINLILFLNFYRQAYNKSKLKKCI